MKPNLDEEPPHQPAETANATASTQLEAHVADLGNNLVRRIRQIVEDLPVAGAGPVVLARTLGVDKVLSSRVLKAIANRDPMAALHMMPGPQPLRRLIRAAGRRGASPALVADAERAIDEFDSLIRREAGDRSALDAILSAWLPEARAQFELRRKQAAFRAISQLRGAAAHTNLATVLLYPSADGQQLDVVWVFGLLGLQRLRPGCPVKFASRRVSRAEGPRLPQTLDGVPVEGLEGLRLDAFCSSPPARLDVHRVREVVHYTLADDGFGPRSAVDLVFCEVNRSELPRYVPSEQRRKRYVFAEISTPVKLLVFDTLVHDELCPEQEPTLYLYDTAFEGVADVNDPARDIDRLDLCESIQPLGRGIARFRTAEVPRYAELLRTVCAKLGWDGERLRGYRCRIDYPLYGTQVAIAFDAPAS